MVHFINTNNIYIYIYIYNVYVDRNTASNIHFINRNNIYNVEEEILHLTYFSHKKLL